MTKEEIAEILRDGDRPYYSVGQIKGKLAHGPKSDPPIRARLGEEIGDQTLGRYYRVKGPVMGRYLLVNEADMIKEPPNHDELLIKARSM